MKITKALVCILFFGLGSLVFPVAAFAQQGCDVSPFTSAPFTVVFTESLTLSSHISNSSVTSNTNYAERAQGSAMVSFRGQAAGTYVFSGNATSGTGSITSSQSVSTVSSGSLTTSITANGPLGLQIAGVTNAGIGFDIRATDCTASVSISYFIPGTISSSGVDSGGNPIGSTYNDNIYSVAGGAGCGVGGFSQINVAAGQINYSVSCPININGANGTFTASFSTSPVPTATIESIAVNQGVWAVNPTELVSSRPTLIRVKSAGGDPDNTQVQLTMPGVTFKSANPTITKNNTADFVTLAPNVSSSASIQITASIVNTSNQMTLPVEVLSVRPIHYLFVPVASPAVSGGGALSQPAQFNTTVDQACEHLQGSYPVDPSKFYCTKENIHFPRPSLPYFQWVTDYWDLYNMCGLISCERVVGIVTKTWFDTNKLSLKLQDPSAAGWTPPFQKHVSFVEDRFPLTVAHELGHTYFDSIFLPTTSHCEPTCPGTSGFWGQHPDLGVFNPNLDPTVSKDFMGNEVNIITWPDEGTQRWSTPSEFFSLFDEFQKVTPDPEILLVTGAFNYDGTGLLGPMYRNLNGIADTSSSGNGDTSVQVTDANGGVLWQTNSNLVFGTTDLSSPEILPYVAFGVAIPYTTAAAEVKLMHVGKVVASVRIPSKLLTDAITSIPSAGFIRTPEQLRTALILKVAALDQQLASGDLVGARNNLQKDIAVQLHNWLIDGYATQSPLQYTKQQILDLIGDLMTHMGR